MTVAIANKNGLTAMTRIMLTANAVPDSLSPGAMTNRISGSAKMMMSTLASKVAIAIRLTMLVDKAQAERLLPDAKR